MATGAAAVMPHSSSIFFLSSTSSSTLILPSSSNTLSVALAAITAPPLQFQFRFEFRLLQLVALSHLSLRQRAPRQLPPQARPRLPPLLGLSHLRPLRTCPPARGAARYEH